MKTHLHRSAARRLGPNPPAWQPAEPVLGAPVRGWVLYDGECPLCLNAVKHLKPILHRRRFGFATLQTPWVQTRLGLKPGDPLDEMKLLTAGGEVFGGADAQVQIAKAVWWMWPLVAFAQLPGAMFLLRAFYRRIAANRYCLSRVCFKQKPATQRHTTFFKMP